MNKTDLRECILNKIEKPCIPNRDYPSSDFGIETQSQAVQTHQLQKAIDTISSRGGGRLLLPSGIYRTGALQLKDKVEIHLQEPDSILEFVNEDIEKHYPVVLSHWEATPCYNYSPLLYAYKVKDIALTGPGRIDGGADETHWWDWHHQVESAWSSNQVDLQLEDRKALRKMNSEGVPIAERQFGPGHYLRPNFIQFMGCERILLKDFTIHRSPMWQVNPVMCKSVTIEGITLSSFGPNNDGCDPESCDGVHIVACKFDTGDDCISIKSGRDRDGRSANVPCQNIVIENNAFANGHGGIALGSEMSGGISRVVAVNNHFSSPDLTYALRLKTNARRGGIVEDIILADCEIDHVSGAAVHGTMVYEDGRNGDYLPIFRNILIENVKAHGGDYGIFLEAFSEVPISGLVLRNIEIDGASQKLHGRNWEAPLIESVTINGETYPRPTKVQILGVTQKGQTVSVKAETYGLAEPCEYRWEVSKDSLTWRPVDSGQKHLIEEAEGFIRVLATNQLGHSAYSHSYKLIDNLKGRTLYKHLICRGLLGENDLILENEPVTRSRLSKMLLPLIDREAGDLSLEASLELAIDKGFLAKDESGHLNPMGFITRQEMATVAMQACGINYKNASSTMPTCTDVADVYNNYGTNVARALYFEFMALEEDGSFLPLAYVTMGQAMAILKRVASFAGL